MVEKRGSIVPFSMRVTDCFDTPARSANSPCDQFSRPRAALILAAKMMLDGIYLGIACVADDGWVIKTSPPFVVKDGLSFV